MPTATVLVPTHNHGRLLGYAIGSALAQTVTSLEVFIVGDGVDEATRAVALDLVAADPRVRFFDRPKGDRHGEAVRHAALRDATGSIVCYLSDDDLWLPHHVETMVSALKDADFAHAVPIYFDAAGSMGVHRGDLDVAALRARMRGGFNFIPLSAAAHTLEFYRRLPCGWHPAPPDLPTDLHMWHQILGVDGCRAVSTGRATLLNFPALFRRDWSIERRADELSRWSGDLRLPTLEADLATAALRLVMRSYVEVDESSRAVTAYAESLHTVIAEGEAQRGILQARIAVVAADLGAATERAASAEDTVRAMEKTLRGRYGQLS
jgi:GalNAc5-diNAcBac-PP-undecaprenol beta-1,3-glucosyltransferase